jgi:hypothetical protein
MIHTSDEFHFPSLREMVPILADDLFNVLTALLKRNVDERPQTSAEVLALLDDTKAEAIPIAIIKSIAVETEFIPPKQPERQTIKREPTKTLQQQSSKPTPKPTSLPTKQSVGIQYWNTEKVKKWFEEKAGDPVYYWTFIVVTIAFFGLIAWTLKPLINPDSSKKVSKKSDQSVVTKTEPTPPSVKTPSPEVILPITEPPIIIPPVTEPDPLTTPQPITEPSPPAIPTPELLSFRTSDILEKFICIPYKNIGKIGAGSIPKTWEELETLQEEFYLSGNEKIEDNDIRSLQELKQLVSLNLGVSVKLTDKGLEYLKDQTQLRELDLNSGNLTDNGLAALSGLILLQRLSLNGCKQIGDDGIKHLAGLTNLTSFNLPGSKITDQSLEILGKINSLTELLLWKSEALTDDGLIFLELLRNLEILNIRDCPKLTEEAVTRIKDKLPKCKIIFGNGDN